MPPALLLSVGIHLVVIFGFLISPAGDSALKAANRAVTVLLTTSAAAPEQVAADAADNQQGLLTASHVEPVLPTDPAISPAATRHEKGATEVMGLTMATPQALLASPPVAARAAAHADYLRQWQDRIERFGNAYYRGLALRHGDGDVRLRVTVGADGSLRNIALLSSSGSEALDRAAVDTVEQLAPFAPFPDALAAEASELSIVRTWQFRR